MTDSQIKKVREMFATMMLPADSEILMAVVICLVSKKLITFEEFTEALIEAGRSL